MPTRSDFEAAAEKFTTASGLVDQLAVSAASAGAAQILRGGSLGRQVPLQIASAKASAEHCRQALVQASEVCLQRASIIAEYEQRLQMFDVESADFFRASQAWSAGVEHSAWLLNNTDPLEEPIDMPQSPTRPAPPPEWAQVRRL